MASHSQFSLVLSGGGLKGLAHVGVLRALEERGLEPAAVVGCSIGALIAAAWATGMSVREMEDRALAVKRSDVFRVAHFDMAFKRMRSPAVYRAEPLQELIVSIVGDRTFADLPRRLVVNTVDINTGNQLLWGLPGLTDAKVADAVFASCALPGILPPRTINGHVCVDGAVVENLPVRASLGLCQGPIIAVDVGGSGGQRRAIERQGFASTYARGLELVMNTLSAELLRAWHNPPVVIVRPRVERIPMFAFNRTPYLIAEGFHALHSTLEHLPRAMEDLPPGIHPQREVILSVDDAKCVACGVCYSRQPHIFRRKPDGRAEVKAPRHWWSPLDDRILRGCPTGAITAEQGWPLPD